jgi:hypothetical protein
VNDADLRLGEEGAGGAGDAGGAALSCLVPYEPQRRRDSLETKVQDTGNFKPRDAVTPRPSEDDQVRIQAPQMLRCVPRDPGQRSANNVTFLMMDGWLRELFFFRLRLKDCSFLGKSM